MTELKTLPEFDLEKQSGERLSSKELSGKHVVLYFYPKDDTPGCTVEAKDFSHYKADFDALNTVILGVSADSVSSHEKFCNKHSLNIDLLSDPEMTLIKACGVWQEKSMYGKTFMGIVRTSFLFNQNGDLIKSWHKVKVKGHAEAVLAELKSL